MLAIAVIAILVLDVVWGVATRYLLGEQAKWSEELARFLLIWVSMLGGALAFRNKEHLGIDFLVAKFDDETRLGMRLFKEAIVCLAALGIFVIGGYQLVSDAMVLGQTTPALGWMMGYVYLCVPISGIFIMMFSLEDMAEAWSMMRSGTYNVPSDAAASGDA